MAGPADRHRKRHRESISTADENDRKKLKTFTERDDTLRSIATCKICFRMLYEPYTLGCGHTYCYSCLDQWFRDGERRKPTCPDCRTIVSRPPAPAYLLREMVREMLRHGTLLPDGETVGEHAAHEREEADLVEADKTNTHPQTGGLFKGRFRQDRVSQRPLHDMEDGVMRCPHCTWELEDDDGACLHCGYNMFADSEDDSWREDGVLSGEEENDGELDEDMDMDDAEFDESFVGNIDPDHPDGHIPLHGTHPLAELYWREEGSDASQEDNVSQGAHSEEEYSSDDDSSMDGFVVDEDEEANNGSSSDSSTSTTRASSHQQPTNANQRRAIRRVIDDEDEDDESETDDDNHDENNDQHGRSIVPHEPINDEPSSEESSSEDELDHRHRRESTNDTSDADESNDSRSTRSGTSQTDGTNESSDESESDGEDDNARPSSGRIFNRRGMSNRHQGGARFAERMNIHRPRTQAVR